MSMRLKRHFALSPTPCMQVPEAVEETDGFGRTNNVAPREKEKSSGEEGWKGSKVNGCRTAV